jgi:hypothetical protein
MQKYDKYFRSICHVGPCKTVFTAEVEQKGIQKRRFQKYPLTLTKKCTFKKVIPKTGFVTEKWLWYGYFKIRCILSLMSCAEDAVSITFLN